MLNLPMMKKMFEPVRFKEQRVVEFSQRLLLLEVALISNYKIPLEGLGIGKQLKYLKESKR